MRLARDGDPGQFGASRHHRHPDLGHGSAPRTAPRRRDAAPRSTNAPTRRAARAGRPEDIANGVLWLASDEALFTGTELVIDGGRSIGSALGSRRTMRREWVSRRQASTGGRHEPHLRGNRQNGYVVRDIGAAMNY